MKTKEEFVERAIARVLLGEFPEMISGGMGNGTSSMRLPVTGRTEWFALFYALYHETSYPYTGAWERVPGWLYSSKEQAARGVLEYLWDQFPQV